MKKTRREKYFKERSRIASIIVFTTTMAKYYTNSILWYSIVGEYRIKSFQIKYKQTDKQWKKREERNISKKDRESHRLFTTKMAKHYREILLDFHFALENIRIKKRNNEKKRESRNISKIVKSKTLSLSLSRWNSKKKV